MFEYPIKALELLKSFVPTSSRFLIKNWYLGSYGSLAYTQILSISGCWFIRFNNEFVLPDREPQVINILYGWSGICGQISGRFNLLEGSRDFAVPTCFSVCFSKTFPKGEYANLTCSIICLWLESKNSSPVRYSYLINFSAW